MWDEFVENAKHLHIVLPIVLAGTFAEVVGVPGALGLTVGIAFFVGLQRGRLNGRS